MIFRVFRRWSVGTVYAPPCRPDGKNRILQKCKLPILKLGEWGEIENDPKAPIDP